MARKELIAALEALEPALRDLESAIQDAGGGGLGGGGLGGGGVGGGLVPGGRAGPGGGRGGPPVAVPGGGGGGDDAGGIMAMGRKHPVVAGIATIAAIAGPPIGHGIASAAQGGSFSAGALSEITQMLAKVPVLGEASGVAGAARVDVGVQDIVNQIAEVESRGTQLTEAQRGFLIGEKIEIEERKELSRRTSTMMKEEMLTKRPSREGLARPTWRDALLSTGGLSGILAGQLLESAGTEQFR